MSRSVDLKGFGVTLAPTSVDHSSFSSAVAVGARVFLVFLVPTRSLGLIDA